MGDQVTPDLTSRSLEAITAKMFFSYCFYKARHKPHQLPKKIHFLLAYMASLDGLGGLNRWTAFTASEVT